MAPALSIFAGNSNFASDQSARELLPNWTSEQFAGTGHFLMMEKPEEFNRMLSTFLDRIKF